jgi:DNA-binding MarR family transcriptional regulator
VSTKQGPLQEDIGPGLVGRCEWELEQTRRDVEVLAWVGRFRFVTPKAISERFDVSWQQANARVRRMERLGLLGCERQHRTQPQAVFLTGKGHELLGFARRRPPRADVQREHEAAIVWLVTELERSADQGTRVLTERECRQREAADRADRFSVDVAHSGPRKDRRRWPDVVLETSEGRRAIEIEFAPKGSDRLQRIIDAYQIASPYTDTVFYVKNAALGRRIKQIAARRGPATSYLFARVADVHVEAWPALPREQRDGYQKARRTRVALTD